MLNGGGWLARVRRAWRQDILFRLGCGIFLAVALSTAVYTTYMMQSMRSEAEQHLRERAERLAAVLSKALARPLFDINSAAVSSVVDASGAVPEVLVVRVLGPGGGELASYVSPLREPVAAIQVHRDISYSDARHSYAVGSIDLAFSRQQIDADLRRQIVHTVTANLLLALGIVLSIFIVGRKAAQPFADIQRALEKLTRGETDIALSGIAREDQVGRLSGAVLRFRDALTRLRDAERELRELNNDLERRIAARTQELSSSMEQARDSEAKLQTIVDTALDAVVRMDLGGRIVGWNRQAEIIFGWSGEEALGQALDNTIIPPRFRYDHRRGMQRFMAGGSGAVLDTRIEVYGLRRTGEEFPIELAITKIKLEQQDGYEFCAFIRDISERREREQKLLSANVMAEAANVAKSEFLANMSHEIRTPMSAIIGMAYLALRTGLTPKQHDYVGKIHRAAQSLLGIINDILDFSKIEAGRLEVEHIPFFLEDVLANVASVTAQRAADKQLEYLFNVPSGVPRHLVGDPLRLGQVLINLVNNAVKFTGEGELELSCALVEEGAADGRVGLRFAVRDTGIGMTAQQKGKLFRAFSQANGSTTRQYGGTGLGLSISQQLVRLMGGEIDVSSEVGQGSTFVFTLRFALSGQPERVTVVPEALNNARVLLVDDCPVALDILEEALHNTPLRVERATSGEEALAAIAAADVAGDAYLLVLSDWQMPGMDGIELARRVRHERRLRKPPGMVLVTAFGREEVQHSAEQAGVIGFLFKPIGQSALVDTLVSFVAPRALLAPAAPRVAGQLAAQVTGAVGVASGHPAGVAARVLLVEDNPINQEIASELMAMQGIVVDVANNGREALDMLRQAGPAAYDLVLMDLEMPLLDGHAATRKLRMDNRYDHLPVIAMTAHALSDVRDRCLAEGMQDYLTKPIDPQQLAGTLARWLGTGSVASGAVAKAYPGWTPAPASASASLVLPAAMRLDGLDSARGLHNVAGDSRLYRQMLERFRDSQRDIAGLLRDALADGDLAGAARHAHTLRGSAGTVGANALENAARELEAELRHVAALDDGERAAGLQAVAPLAATLEAALGGVLAALDMHFQSALAAADAGDGASSDTPAQACAQLRSLLADYSGDAADYFASVRAQLAGLLAPAAFERLAGHVARYEFATAVELLDGAAPAGAAP